MPVQACQFAFVPAVYKVPFICLAGFVWVVVLSTLAGSVCKFREPKPDHTAALDNFKGVVVPNMPLPARQH